MEEFFKVYDAMAELTAEIINDFNTSKYGNLTHKYYNNESGGKELLKHYRQHKSNRN